MKYIVVTGGVVSGLGKGVTISSVGRMLQGCGLTVTSIKIDPYLNVDAGTMSPFEHGEVFVLRDGGEADLDLGNYERFLSIELTSDHNLTTGKIYRDVIARERRGDYLGKTVQVVPHISDEIQDWIERVAHIPVSVGKGKDEQRKEVADVCLIEVGGTVGDIESMIFLEALRQFQFRVGVENFCLMFVSLVPVLGVVGEQKTKPTQHGVKELRSLGLSPHIILCRSTTELEPSTKQKISGFCHVKPECVLSVYDVTNIYHVPLLLIRQGLHEILVDHLRLMDLAEEEKKGVLNGGKHTPPPPPASSNNNNDNNTSKTQQQQDQPTKRTKEQKQLLQQRLQQPDMDEWTKMAQGVDMYEELVTIALIGKYTGLQDSYLSVIKALRHASMKCKRRLEIVWVDATHLEDPPPTTTTTETKVEDKCNGGPANGGEANSSSSSSSGGGGGGGGSSSPGGSSGNGPSAKELHEIAWEQIRSADGVVVPGGFGNRGFNGKTLAANYCRTSGKPYLGICLGFQAMVVEYARNVLNLTQANSAEFEPKAEHDVVIFMPEIDKTAMGGTMRLGARDTRFTHGSIRNEKEEEEDGRQSVARLLYNSQEVVSERHRHRYEVNPNYVDSIHQAGLKFVGRDAETGKRMEIGELPQSEHRFYVGCQYHPEFQSRPLNPSPLFLGLILASCGGEILENHLKKQQEQ